MARPVVYDDGVRARLLDAAAEHVFAHGLGTLSLRTIAREAGTTTAAVYALFGSKDGLVAGLYERAVTRFTEQLAAAPRRADPRDDLAALGLAYRRSALADPHGYRVMFGGHVDPATLPRHIGAAAAASFAPPCSSGCTVLRARAPSRPMRPRPRWRRRCGRTSTVSW